VPTTITYLLGAGVVPVIGVLPDDVLLEIFYFHHAAPLGEYEHWWMEPKAASCAWHTLVHVCQTWRYVVLASPVYLKLFLICTERTPVKKMLHIWPPLPLLILLGTPHATSNITAALEQRDRVGWIVGDLRGFEVAGEFPTVMLEPFPALTHIYLHQYGRPLLLPDTFLGGSAPRLQFLKLSGVRFLTLPELLLSTNDLVQLHLWHMPSSGYISPDAIVTGLSALTRLEALTIGFDFLDSLPPQSTRRLPLQTRAVLPSLTSFLFQGVSDYLDDLVTLIDAPHLQCVIVEFFKHLNLQIGQLARFICHAEMLRSFDRARVVFRRYGVEIKLHPRAAKDPHRYLELKIERAE
jgi:hypothetical protein